MTIPLESRYDTGHQHPRVPRIYDIIYLIYITRVVFFENEIFVLPIFRFFLFSFVIRVILYYYFFYVKILLSKARKVGNTIFLKNILL